MSTRRVGGRGWGRVRSAFHLHIMKSKPNAATFPLRCLRQTVALRSFTATPQRIKCIHPDPHNKVRPRRRARRGEKGGKEGECQGWSSHSRADKQKRRIQKRFCLLHFIARAQGERLRKRERVEGEKEWEKEQKVKEVKQNRWQRMKQQQVE